jgi:hypothetical protein
MFRYYHLATTIVALFTSTASGVLAQEPLTPAVDSLNQRIAVLGARLDSLEAGVCPPAPIHVAPWAPSGDAAVDSLAASLLRLEGRVGRVTAAHCAGLAAGGAPPDTVLDELAAIRAAAAAAAEEGAARDSTPQPTGPRSLNVLNPEISVTGNLLLIARDESPQRDNAELREVEVSFQSALDPFSTAKVFLTFSEDEIGVEEGYLYWVGLPGRIRLDAGKFRQQLRRASPAWACHSIPLSRSRWLGELTRCGSRVRQPRAIPSTKAARNPRSSAGFRASGNSTAARTRTSA